MPRIRVSYSLFHTTLLITLLFAASAVAYAKSSPFIFNPLHADSAGLFSRSVLDKSTATVGTVFNANGNVDAGVFASSRLQCTGCTMTNPQGSGALGTLRLNVLALTANRVLLFNSTLTGGGINSDTTLVIAPDTTIEGFVPNGLSLLASNHTLVNLTRVQVKGPMRFFQGSNAQLLGVTQTASAVPNQIDDGAFVRIGDASPAAGGPPSIPSAIQGFMLRNFSKLTLLQTSQISGNLNCSIGADAFCSTPTNVSGISNCGLCPKP